MKNENYKQLRSVSFLPEQKAIVNIPVQNRSVRTSLPENGVEVSIVSFEKAYYGRTNNYGLHPGIYSNPRYMTVKDAGGKSWVVPDRYLNHLPDVSTKSVMVERGSLWQAELPQTAFWEMDKVLVGGQEIVIQNIDYELIGKVRFNDKATPIYNCTIFGGSNIALSEDEIQLVERGNVWRRAHGLEMKFADIREEAGFYLDVGEKVQLINPITQDYSWTLEQALEAIQDGRAHCFLYGIDAKAAEIASPARLFDVEVGERVRAEVMHLFNLPDKVMIPELDAVEQSVEEPARYMGMGKIGLQIQRHESVDPAPYMGMGKR